jgi:hypothetical protein
MPLLSSWALRPFSYEATMQFAKSMLKIFAVTALAISGVTLCYIRVGVAQQDEHAATEFECGFVYEKTKGGKSSDASCSYNGEYVFGTPSLPFPASEHCKTEPTHKYKDFVNFRIDLLAKDITWDTHIGSSPFRVLERIEYYMRTEKLSREEATRKAQVTYNIQSGFKIFNVNKIYDTYFNDEITQADLKTPKYVPAYLITFGDKGSNYSIYIAGQSGRAILSKYDSDHTGNSWVNLRFGKCRIKATSTP